MAQPPALTGMDDATIQRLNALNQEFYRAVGSEFDETRSRPWPGWERLLTCLPDAARPLSVLDVGCGNGRLGVFLAEHAAPGGLSYHGLDTDETLLARAEAALAPLSGVAAALERRDAVTHPPDSGQYDLVALFGVLHHIPAAAGRAALIRALAERTAPGGLLVFTCWRFMEYARFRDRVVPWPDDLAPLVEPGDYLLDWRRGPHALRYCHYVDDAEHSALIAAAGLSLLLTYRADGQTGDANLYTLLRR